MSSKLSNLKHLKWRVYPPICIFILLVGQCAGQATVHGFVYGTNGLPVASANALLIKGKDSSLVKATITNQKGGYLLSHVQAGNYRLLIASIGFDTLYVPPFFVSGNESKIMDTLRLVGTRGQLAAITVSAKKPFLEQKIDRMVINVQSSITSTGSTVLEILERSPGVDVDRQNSSISMNGKDGVVVMIDGKVTHLPMAAVFQLLAGMGSGNIERIELITAPPAGFDAEGNAGFINIVTKKNTETGTNGSYSGSFGVERGTMQDAAFNFNHRKGKLNLYGDLSSSRQDSKFFWAFYHQSVSNGITTATNTEAPRDYTSTDFNGRLGLDYQPDKNTVIGVLVSANGNLYVDNSYNSGTVSLNSVTDTVMQLNSHESHSTYNIISNINMEHSFNAGEKLVFNADFMHWMDDDPNNYFYTYMDGKGNFLYNETLKSTKLTPSDLWVFTADYSKAFGKKINLDAGVKATLSKLTNNIEVDSLWQNQWLKEAGFTSKYHLTEDYPAAYTSLNMRPDEHTTITMGLRYEYTYSNLGSDSVKNVVDRHYGDFFPNFAATYKIDKNNSVDLLYNRRITRPTFNDMAPWVLFIDPYTFFTGNSALQPAFSNNYEVHYTLLKYILKASYSYEKYPIAHYFPKVDPTTNIETLTAQNLTDTKTFTASAIIPVRLSSWFNMSLNPAMAWQQTNTAYNGSALTMNEQYFQLKGTADFSLPHDFSFQISGFYKSGGLFGFYNTTPWGTLDLGLQKKLGTKGSVRIVGADILNTITHTLSANIPSQNLNARFYVHPDYPSLKISYSRSFGSTGIKEKREHSTGSEDELKRLQ